VLLLLVFLLLLLLVVLAGNTHQLPLVGSIQHSLVGSIRLRRSAVDVGLLLRSVA